MKDVQRPCSSKRITKQLSNSRSNTPLASKYFDRPIATARSPSIASGAYWPWYVPGVSRFSSHALTIASRPRATWSPASQGARHRWRLRRRARRLRAGHRSPRRARTPRANGSRCLGPVALVILPGAPSAYAACAWLHVRSAERALGAMSPAARGDIHPCPDPFRRSPTRPTRAGGVARAQGLRRRRSCQTRSAGSCDCTTASMAASYPRLQTSCSRSD